jgi:ADP-ribosylglycohydrolase
MPHDASDRTVGCLVGLAVCDALGTTLEFSRPGTFDPIDDMLGGGPFGLDPGQWTDDTSMALCLADSLVECGGFDPADQMRRYVRWWRTGHRSSRPGRCFDIGVTVRQALARFEQAGEPFAGATDEYSAGNGSLMRLGPVAMFYASNPAGAIARADDSSRTTHGAAEAVDACRYFAALLVGALRGEPKPVLLSKTFYAKSVPEGGAMLAPRIREIASGSYNFREGALLAVNLGDDADTTGAVYGQLAGAFYGAGAIPRDWRDRLYEGDAIAALARRLHDRRP